MACFHPIDAWKLDSGDIVFGGKKTGSGRYLQLPCGQCIGCRLERSRQWAVRCMHEAQLHERNVFLTLTYNDDHVPTNNSLDHRDFQLFMKRLRFDFRPRVIRYYMCGEYGEDFQRPHFHACIFNVDFTDKKKIGSLSSGADLYRSARLDELWGKGFASIGEVTFESAAYVARYCLKKVTGARAEEHYKRVDWATGEIVSVKPEYARMSLRKAIAKEWFEKYKNDVYHGKDYVVTRDGMKMKPPRYYDKLLESVDGFQYDYIRFLREQKAKKTAADNTPERLAVREEVTAARLAFKKRTIS